MFLIFKMCHKINKDDEREIKQIENIWRERSIEAHRFVAPDPNQFWRSRLGQFQNDIKNCKTYVYEINREIKGFITFEDRNDYIYILEMFTYKSGEGIGTKLLDKVVKRGKRLELDVYVLNIASVNWYAKKGFVVTGSRECPCGELKEFDCEKECLKYKQQRRKYHMVRLPQDC